MRALERRTRASAAARSAFELADARLRGLALLLDLGAQRGGGALEHEDALAACAAQLSLTRGEARGERVALLARPAGADARQRVAALASMRRRSASLALPLGLVAALLGADAQLLGALAGGLHRGACLLDAALQTVELRAVAAPQAGHVLLGLDAQLLLGVLALLDAAQLVLAVGELLGGALALALGLELAAAQVGELALERVDRRLGGVGAPESGAASPGPARRARRSASTSRSSSRARPLRGAVSRRLPRRSRSGPAYARARTPAEHEGSSEARDGGATRCAGARPCATAATTAR